MEEKATHVNHHWVPDFLLSEWESAPDNKLSQYSWVPKKLDIQRYTAKATAKQRHLYSSTSSNGQKDVSIEKNYFGPEIDDKAAPIREKLIEGGREALSAVECEIWARFLVAQIVRTPEMIRQYAAAAKLDFEESVAQFVERTGRESFLDYVQSNAPHVGENVAVAILKEVIENAALNRLMLGASWRVLRFDQAKTELLIGDNPLLTQKPIPANFIIVLPLGPRALFCAARFSGTLDNMGAVSQDDVVSMVNMDSVKAATKYVYATNSDQTELIERYLRRPS